MIRITPIAVTKPRPGTGRPKIRSYIGPKMSSIQLQNFQRIQAVAATGTVKKKPGMKRDLSQFSRRNILADHTTRALSGSRKPGPSAHDPEKLLRRRELHELVLPLLAPDRRRLAAVIVAGQEDRV